MDVRMKGERHLPVDHVDEGLAPHLFHTGPPLGPERIMMGFLPLPHSWTTISTIFTSLNFTGLWNNAAKPLPKEDL